MVSEAVKDHLESNGSFKGKIKVIYNGVNSDKFHPDSNNDRLYEELNIPLESKVVGMIGRVNSWKGQRDFVETMNVVLQIDKQAFAVLAGDDFMQLYSSVR